MARHCPRRPQIDHMVMLQIFDNVRHCTSLGLMSILCEGLVHILKSESLLLFLLYKLNPKTPLNVNFYVDLQIF